MESGDNFPRFDELRHSAFNRGNRNGLRFGEIVAPDGHEASDSPCRRRTAQGITIHSFGLSSTRRPLGYNTKAAPESLARQLSPQLCAIAVTGTPLGIEPWQINFKRVLPHAEHVGSLTT